MRKSEELISMIRKILFSNEIEKSVTIIRIIIDLIKYGND